MARERNEAVRAASLAWLWERLLSPLPEEETGKDAQADEPEEQQAA